MKLRTSIENTIEKFIVKEKSSLLVPPLFQTPFLKIKVSEN